MFFNDRSGLLHRLGVGALDLLLPVTCYFCGRQVDRGSFSPAPICDEHANRLQVLSPPLCRLCSAPLARPGVVEHSDLPRKASPEKFNRLPVGAPLCGDCRQGRVPFEFVVCGYAYTGRLRQIIHDWKFTPFSPWGKWLGRRLAQLVEDRFEPNRWEYLVPVPLHSSKLKDRGFNQAGQLAETLASEFALEFFPALEKPRETRSQSELSGSERVRNVAGCFEVDRANLELVTKSSVLLVDDIYTTGSTLRSAAEALIDAGAEDVGGLVLSRSLPGRYF